MVLSKLSLTQNPGLVDLTKTVQDDRLKCCVLCTAKANNIDEGVMNYLIEGVRTIYDLSERLEKLLKERQISKKFDRYFWHLINNMSDFQGKYEVDVWHPHYYVSETISLTRTGPILPMEEKCLRPGQVLILYEPLHRMCNSDWIVNDIITSHNMRPQEPHLYGDLRNMPKEKVIVLYSVNEGGLYEHLDHAGIFFDGDINEDGKDVTSIEHVKTLKQVMMTQKESFYPHVRVLVVDKIPYTASEQGVQYPTAQPWLKLIQEVYGSLQQLIVVMIVETEGFILAGNSSIVQIDACVKNGLDVDEEIEIVSVSGEPVKDIWTLVTSVKTTVPETDD